MATQTAPARTTPNSPSQNQSHENDGAPLPGNDKALNPSRISISESHRNKLVALLNDRLADSIDLHSQVKHAHWNVKGPDFIALHKLFDEVAAAVDEHVDTIAERLTALGGEAAGTLALAARRSTMPAYPSAARTGRDHVEAVADALAAFGNAARESIDKAEDLKDACTVDLFTQVARDIDKYLWFVEAHLHADS